MKKLCLIAIVLLYAFSSYGGQIGGGQIGGAGGGLSSPVADADVSDTLTSSIFKGSGTTTDAVDLATAEVAGVLPDANIANDITLDLLDLSKLTGAPASPVAGKLYYADCTTWDPSGLGIGKAYYVVYDGASYIALFDEDGAWYVSSIDLPTLLAAQLNDTSSPHTLVESELKNKIISNSGAGASEWDFPARTEGWNVIFIKETDANMTLDPNGTETFWFRTDTSAYTQMAAGEAIVNTTAGKSTITIFSTESAIYCTGDANWAEETP